MKRMLRPVYKMQAKVWLYPGPAGWHFVTLPQKQSDEIRKDKTAEISTIKEINGHQRTKKAIK